jgi:hypothetical protein
MAPHGRPAARRKERRYCFIREAQSAPCRLTQGAGSASGQDWPIWDEEGYSWRAKWQPVRSPATRYAHWGETSTLGIFSPTAPALMGEVNQFTVDWLQAAMDHQTACQRAAAQLGAEIRRCGGADAAVQAIASWTG